MASLCFPKYKPAGKPAQRSKTYHIRYWCKIRKRTKIISTGCKRKRNAERRLRQFIDMVETGEYWTKWWPKSPFVQEVAGLAQQHDTLDTEACLLAFEQDLRSGKVRKRGRGKPPTEAHARLAMSRVRSVVSGWPSLASLSPTGVAGRLDSECKGKSQQTRKHYERAVKALSAWLCSSGRLPADPLAGLAVTEVAAEAVAHRRGAFSLQQVASIAAAAKRGGVLQKLSGEQRQALWLTAAGTGLRMQECCALRAQDFAPDLSSVSLSGEHTKNGQAVRQPLPAFVQQAVRPLLRGLAPGDRLWPCHPKTRFADLLRVDAAGVCTIGREGMEEQGFVLDAHSLRHTYATLVDRVGVSERLGRKLARISSGALLSHYTHREFSELAEAVAAFPSLPRPKRRAK